MSDENSGSSSSAEQAIPKIRFDEVIAQKNQAAQEAQFLRQTLDQVLANQRQQQQTFRQPEPMNPRLQRMKEEDPEMYQEFIQSKRDAKELRAGYANQADQLDRLTYVQQFGEVGKKRMAEVEQILDQERRNGNFRVTRAAILQWKLGQERLTRDAEDAVRPPAPAAPAVDVNVTIDAPPSNPRNVTTISGGTASGGKVVKTKEERIAELKDITF